MTGSRRRFCPERSAALDWREEIEREKPPAWSGDSGPGHSLSRASLRAPTPAMVLPGQ